MESCKFYLASEVKAEFLEVRSRDTGLIVSVGVSCRLEEKCLTNNKW